MANYFKKQFTRLKNRIKFHYKKKISKNSKDIYAIVLMALYHENKRIICDPLVGDIIIKLKDLGYHIIITHREVVITNHDFPNLGPIEEVVIERIITKAKNYISSLRQAEKREILANHEVLLKNVKEKVRISSRLARLKNAETNEINY